jgi:hypothetical protein
MMSDTPSVACGREKARDSDFQRTNRDAPGWRRRQVGCERDCWWLEERGEYFL